MANAFFIEHHMMSLAHRGGKEACVLIANHLRDVTRNVVDAMPYFNKTNGRDHFFVSMFDHWPFCEHVCHQHELAGEITMLLLRLENANFIGNFGMDDNLGDKDYHQSWSMKNLAGTNGTQHLCHKVGRDIVIPQPYLRGLITFRKEFRSTGGLWRSLDSSFSGSYWGERVPVMKRMAKYKYVDYQVNGTELFGFDLSGGSSDFGLTTRALFMYHVCGYACWSNRLYHAMGVGTVPIIVATGSLQAFERFVDWREISCKMMRETWDDLNKRTRWRRDNLRTAADEWRRELGAALERLGLRNIQNASWRSFGIANEDPVPSDEHLTSLVDNEYRLAPSGLEGALLQSKIWKKRAALEGIIKWFDFGYGVGDEEHNAWRLLWLEVWCRVVDSGHAGAAASDATAICKRSPDFTARKEYC
jgi:hypothetical protein